MSKFWKPEDRRIPRRRTYVQSILKMENASCKSLVLRWCTLILYSVGYRYLSPGLPFLCRIPGQAEQLLLLHHVSLAQDGKFFTPQRHLVKEGNAQTRAVGWGRREHSALTQLHSELQVPLPGPARGDIQRLRSHLKIKVKLTLVLEEKHFKEMDLKEVALEEKHLEKKGFQRERVHAHVQQI